MAISKTSFINYTRCRRYNALENVRKEKLNSKMSIEEYKKEEIDEQKKEILSSMFEQIDDIDDDIDLIEKTDAQLEAMMDYYKEVELESGKLVESVFGGTSIYSKDTYSQKMFECDINNIKYICYVDIYNETDDEINIIEVKATTSKKYKKDITYGARGKDKYPMFIKVGDVYKISECVSNEEKVLENYQFKLNTLKDRFRDEGKYIFDLAVQRYIIEHDLKQKNINKKINYYLAVLNCDYIYDGYTENNKRVYRNINNEEIIDLIELNNITFDMQDIVDKYRINLESYLNNPNIEPCNVGVYCNLKKKTECIYKPICYKNIPQEDGILNYYRLVSLKDDTGVSKTKYDLINDGYLKMQDIPYHWLTSNMHIVQRDCLDDHEAHINKNKIKGFINDLKYPIYHLDFETFPCPMPRFKGESPYTQSVFEFSLHVESESGKCDKEKDNFVYLAHSNSDEREELVKALVEHIPMKSGLMLAQNVSFEKSRLRELGEVFPKYKEHLNNIADAGYDLLYIIQNNKEISEKLGLNPDEINYYNTLQHGSYSIKKTLPLFTDLKYSDLEIQNGVDALVEYSKFDSYDKNTLEQTRNNLIEYCKQDTWAMVCILNGLRKLVN